MLNILSVVVGGVKYAVCCCRCYDIKFEAPLYDWFVVVVSVIVI